MIAVPREGRVLFYRELKKKEGQLYRWTDQAGWLAWSGLMSEARSGRVLTRGSGLATERYGNISRRRGGGGGGERMDDGLATEEHAQRDAHDSGDGAATPRRVVRSPITRSVPIYQNTNSKNYKIKLQEEEGSGELISSVRRQRSERRRYVASDMKPGLHGMRGSSPSATVRLCSRQIDGWTIGRSLSFLFPRVGLLGFDAAWFTVNQKRYLGSSPSRNGWGEGEGSDFQDKFVIAGLHFNAFRFDLPGLSTRSMAFSFFDSIRFFFYFTRCLCVMLVLFFILHYILKQRWQRRTEARSRSRDTGSSTLFTDSSEHP
uniref:Uncharacterized protein n=1 Tax=Coccidioides posadasii RMSCC 3488 TaxID=454284 RepID=A0A0J6I372_COCPO|nr:hypothetical protein CPAG_02160 [Coccidioides posadasii RMSCC 3488]